MSIQQPDLFLDNTVHWIRSSVVGIATLAICGARATADRQHPVMAWYQQNVTCPRCLELGAIDAQPKPRI